MGGKAVDSGLCVNLRKFIEEECMVGLCSMKCTGALTHQHSQMVVKGNLSGLPVLNKKIKICLGWDEKIIKLFGHVVSCKTLQDEKLHTFLRMVGYYMTNK